jgi:hypothetical protein
MALARPMQNDALSILSQPGAPVAAQVAVAFAVLVTKWAPPHPTGAGPIGAMAAARCGTDTRGRLW